jgi:hypothetical protein
MSGPRHRRHALLAAPLVAACLFIGAPSDAGAAARYQDAGEDRGAGRAAETRRSPEAADRDADDSADARRARARERDREQRALLNEDDEAAERARDRRRDARDDDDDRLALDDDDDDDRDGGRRRGSRRQEWFRDPGYYGYGNFPSNEVQDAVVANARAAQARALFRRAENALNSAVRRAVRTFEGSNELSEARKTEKEAYAAYTLARRRALQSVLEDPKYRAIVSLRQDLSDQIDNKRAGRIIDDRSDRQLMADIVDMATLKMNYAADARAMEQLALETDSQTKEAQARHREAAARVAEMKGEFDDALRNDPDLLAARENLEDARIARLTAAAYLKGAAIAAEEALDFAYYLNRYNRYSGAGYQDYREYYPYRFPYRGY